MSRNNYAVVIDDGHFDATTAIAETLAKQGFQVESIMPEIGAIYGSAEEGIMPRLKAIEGVEDVRREKTVQLPPFSERVPQ